MRDFSNPCTATEMRRSSCNMGGVRFSIWQREDAYCNLTEIFRPLLAWTGLHCMYWSRGLYFYADT